MTGQMERRDFVTLLGGAGVAGVGAVYGLSSVATQPAQAQVAGSFEDQTVELPDEQFIEDVVLNGTLTGEYAQTDGIDRATFDVTVSVPSEFGEIISDTIEVTDVDPGTDMVTVEPSYSLADDGGVSVDGMIPFGSGESPHDYNFDVAVTFTVYSGGSEVASDSTEVEGRLTVAPADEDGWQGPENGDGGGNSPSASVTETSFSFDVTLTG